MTVVVKRLSAIGHRAAFLSELFGSGCSLVEMLMGSTELEMEGEGEVKKIEWVQLRSPFSDLCHILSVFIFF